LSIHTWSPAFFVHAVPGFLSNGASAEQNSVAGLNQLGLWLTFLILLVLDLSHRIHNYMAGDFSPHAADPLRTEPELLTFPDVARSDWPERPQIFPVEAPEHVLCRLWCSFH
jgi:hypothetical protein